MSHGNLFFPKKTYYYDHSDVTVDSNVNLVDRSEDPKALVLDFCKPHCIYWKEKLGRCEKKLQQIIKVNPTKSCLYPMRDWVTCVEACAQPKIHNNLVGTERRYKDLV
jgi:ubiquinol-cytochrome c reductase subunit 6